MRWIVVTVLVLVGVGAAGLSGCARFAIVNAPVLSFEGEIVRDLRFSKAHGLALAVYRPPGAPGNAPVVVFFHGGSWQSGDKDRYRFVGMTLAQNGIVTVIPDYRKYPDVVCPAFVENGADAVAWTAAEIARFGGDPAQIYLMGHSAGAHTAALLAADGRYLSRALVPPGTVKGVAGLAGPYDFTPEARRIEAIFGPPERYPLMQTAGFVDGSEPPMLLMHGAEDRTVSRRNLDRLAAALAASGICHRTILYDGLDHIDIVAALSWVYRDSAPVEGDLAAFARDGLDGPGCSG